MARWVCDHCGETGRLPEGEPVESLQCPICGEPVLLYDG